MLAIAILFTAIQCGVEVQSQMQVKEVDIGLGEYVNIELPEYPLAKVYETWAVWSGEQKNPFAIDKICRSVPTRLNMWTQFDLPFQLQNSSLSIDSFERITTKRWIVDMYRKSSGLVYLLFGNGTLLVVKQEKELKIVKNIEIENTGGIQYAEFQLVNNTLFLVTEANLYSINYESVDKVVGFSSSRGLVSTKVIHGRWLAVALKQQGIIFYEFLSDTMVREVSGFGASLFNRQHLMLQDMEWHEQTAILLVLEQSHGVFFFHLSTNMDRVQLNLLPNTLFQKSCNNMVLINQNIYLSCRNLYRYELINEEIEMLQSPQFHVSKMLKFNNFLILIGRNDLAVYHQNKLLEDLEFGPSQILQFIDSGQKQSGQFLSVTADKLALGTYTIGLPAVKCGTTDKSRIGTMKMLIKTEAECDNTYFRALNMEVKWNEGDTCVYTVPMALTLSQQKNIDFEILGYIMIGFLVAVIALIVWACLVRRRAEVLQEALRNFYRQKQSEIKLQEVPVEANQADIQKASSEMAITS